MNMKQGFDKNLKLWYILILVSLFLISYLIPAFILIIILKIPASIMASLFLYYLSIVWLVIFFVTIQRYKIIKGDYRPKPKTIMTRKNLLILYLAITIIVVFLFIQTIFDKDFGAEFAAMSLFGILIILYGIGYLFLSDYLMEKSLKLVKNTNLQINFVLWITIILIITVLIIILLVIPFHLATLENRREGLINNQQKSIETANSQQTSLFKMTNIIYNRYFTLSKINFQHEIIYR